MDIENILNKALNKALISDRIKGTPSSNKIAEFVTNFLKSQQLNIHSVVSSATSKDYNRLYDKISKGEIVPCFVDYDWRDGTPPFRDVAKVRRRDKADIDIGARGISYGGVSSYDLKNKTELKAFTDECERMNLEYYT